MKIFNFKNSAKGFTLLEALLYISLTTIVFLATSILFSLVISARLKQASISIVEEQGNMAMRAVTQAVRNAKGINDLPPGSSSSESLSLITTSTETNPSNFTLINGVLENTIGSDTPVPITSSQVVVTNLLFQNLGQSNTAGTIRIQFVLTTANPERGYQYNYQQTFYGSATIR